MRWRYESSGGSIKGGEDGDGVARVERRVSRVMGTACHAMLACCENDTWCLVSHFSKILLVGSHQRMRGESLNLVFFEGRILFFSTFCNFRGYVELLTTYLKYNI